MPTGGSAATVPLLQPQPNSALSVPGLLAPPSRNRFGSGAQQVVQELAQQFSSVRLIHGLIVMRPAPRGAVETLLIAFAGEADLLNWYSD